MHHIQSLAAPVWIVLHSTAEHRGTTCTANETMHFFLFHFAYLMHQFTRLKLNSSLSHAHTASPRTKELLVATHNMQGNVQQTNVLNSISADIFETVHHTQMVQNVSNSNCWIGNGLFVPKIFRRLAWMSCGNTWEYLRVWLSFITTQFHNECNNSLMQRNTKCSI